MNKYLLLLLLLEIVGCGNINHGNNLIDEEKTKVKIEVGANQILKYLPDLLGKNVGVVANHTSFISDRHLVDTLLDLDVNIVAIFSPEHGFRGRADAGEHIDNSVDSLTQLPIISLYGKNYKPFSSQLTGIDLMVFDIQDVGVRFYTYLSTLHYVMEACAENSIPLLVFDRPNPNGYYVDGPVLENEYTSFVGLHPVPIVYGLTIGEYAQMINGEYWLKDSVKCDLKVIPCLNYNHDSIYPLPIAPSPNLQTDVSVNLYPSLGIFEGTVVSVGRGTDFPFEMFGHPEMSNTGFSFKPESRPGFSKNPKLNGKICYGYLLKDSLQLLYNDTLHLSFIKKAYAEISGKEDFFNAFFLNLVGTAELKKQIQENVSNVEIRESWKEGLIAFMKIREKYLLYPDFSNN